jgi:hypothetical protein
VAVLYRFPGCGLGPGSTRLAVCAAFGVLLVAACISPLSIAAKAGPAPADESVALCSELSERRDRLHAEIARLHAETALVEAELVLLCTERSNETDVGLPPLFALPSHSSAGTADQAIALHQIAPQSAQRAAPARRGGKDEIAYSVHCWAPKSTFTDPACNCLGEPAHPKLGSRPTIKILLPSWYGLCASCRVMPQACFARVPAGLSAACIHFGMHPLSGYLGACIHCGMHPLRTGRVRLWTPFCSRSLLRNALDTLSSCFRTASLQTSGPISNSKSRRGRRMGVAYTRH